MSERDPDRPAPSELEADEARIRRALGVQNASARPVPQQRPEQARQRHRFVQDGEVPVVVLNRNRNADADPASEAPSRATDAALEAERTARAGAERSLREARAVIQSLRTKLAHAELAHGEALAREREARARAEEALREAVTDRAETEQRQRKTAPALPAEAQATPASARRPTRARPEGKSAAAVKVPEPQPVKWWLPSYRAKAGKP